MLVSRVKLAMSLRMERSSLDDVLWSGCLNSAAGWVRAAILLRQRTKCGGRAAVEGGLLVGVGELEEGGLAKRAAEEADSGGEIAVRKAHGDGDARQASGRRDESA